MAFNDRVLNQLVHHNIDLLRFDAGTRRRIRAHLFQLQRELEQMLANVDFTNARRIQRVEDLLKQTDKILKTNYRGMRSTLGKDLKTLAGMEQDFAVGSMNNLFGVDIMSAALTPEKLAAIASNTNILGGPAKDWWARQAANTRHRFANEIRQGYLLGESTQDLVRRVRGTATGKRSIIELADGTRKSVHVFEGGILQVSTREAEALVRTAVQSVANDVRLQTYAANSDVIGSVQALVTLDSRTSDICIAHGSRPDEWTLPDYEPVGGSTHFTGPPPWHFNCRSSLIPITKSWKELAGQDATRKQQRIARVLDNNAPKRVRASMDGGAPRGIGFDKWLKRQPASVQRELLGPTKLKLWKQGNLTLSQTLDQTGRPLTVKQFARNADRLSASSGARMARREVNLFDHDAAQIPEKGTDAFGAKFNPQTVRKIPADKIPTLNTGAYYKTSNRGAIFQVIRTDATSVTVRKFDKAKGIMVPETAKGAIKKIPKAGGATPPAPPKTTRKKAAKKKATKKTTKKTASTTWDDRITSETPMEVRRAQLVEPGGYRNLKWQDVFHDGQGNAYKVMNDPSSGTLTVIRYNWKKQQWPSLTRKGEKAINIPLTQKTTTTKPPPKTRAKKTETTGTGTDGPITGTSPGTAKVVGPSGYHHLKVGDVFKDEFGDLWKVGKVTTQSIRVGPWDPVRGKFLHYRKGQSLKFVKGAKKTVKPTKVARAVPSAAETGEDITKNMYGMYNAPRYGTPGSAKRKALSMAQDNALSRAINALDTGGFNPKLAEMMSNRAWRASSFNMGKRGYLKDPWGRRYKGSVNGAYWNQQQALGMAESLNGKQLTQTWVHEFGHHVDYTLFRNDFRWNKKLPQRLKGKVEELNSAYNGMIQEFQDACEKMSKKRGVKDLTGGGEYFGTQGKDMKWWDLEGKIKGVAPTPYSLYNEKEWFAEQFTTYFNLRGGKRVAMKTVSPKTHDFFELMMSKDMEELWEYILSVGF